MLCQCMMVTIQKMIMKWIGIYVICHFLVQTASHEYGIQLDYERPHNFYNQKQITPLVLMVDATNRLGFSILKHHTFSNHNNVAFSPCGLASVLVALFEGSDGHSSFEIYKSLDIPFDRDLVRVGYRDIHRRLRSYFYQQENVLSGLSLSKENVTIRSSYETILRFYGYDLEKVDAENGGVLTTSTESKRREQDEPENSTPMQTSVQTTDIMTTDPPSIPTDTPTTEMATVKVVTESSSTEYDNNKVTEVKVETTTYIPSESSTDSMNELETETFTESTIKAPATTKVPTTIKAPTTMSTAERETFKITSTDKPTIPTTNVPSTFPPTISTQLPYLSEITTPFFQTTTYPTSRFTYPPTEESTILPVTLIMTSTPKPATHIFKFKPITTTPLPEPEVTPTKRFYNFQTTIPPFTTAIPPTGDFNIPKALNSLTTIPVPTAIRLNPSETSNARLVNPRNSRIYRFKREPTSYNQFIPLAASGYGVSSGVDFYDPYFSYATPNPIDFYPDGNPVYASHDFEQSDHHHDEIDQIFYLSPQDSIRIGFKVYNTLLRFAYIPDIHASVLELPLDSENYSLLIMVPDQPIEDLVNVLGSPLSPSLRDIRAALRNNWIKTIIPKFQLKGNVVLTGDLMKLGIHDIFEPNKADFSPMTDEFGIYARHIEQSITINIRTHANNQLRRYAQQFFDPIKVPVNRPFVFAIIDNELDLAIMVGRVLNPINSRIF